jgi:hypothetical protein
MHSLKAQHKHNTLSVLSMPTYVNDLSCDSCNLNKACSAPRNRTASQKHATVPQIFSPDLRGPFHVPSPYGMRYCLMVVDHHADFMWARFMKSKDETFSQLETILPDARCHAQLGALAPFTNFDSDSIFESAERQLMCTKPWFNTKFSTPYTHRHILGKAERPWRPLRDCDSSMLHAMFFPNRLWSCAISTVVHLRNRTSNRTVGPAWGGGFLSLSSRLWFNLPSVWVRCFLQSVGQPSSCTSLA